MSKSFMMPRKTRHRKNFRKSSGRHSKALRRIFAYLCGNSLARMIGCIRPRVITSLTCRSVLFEAAERTAMKIKMFQLLLCCIAFLCGAAEKSEFDNLLLGNPGKADVVIDRQGFAVGFSNLHRQPLWVIYKLTAEELQSGQHKRTNRFKHDPLIAQSAYPKEYTRSGFDRGHLAPAADMAFSKQTISDSFLMSNMSPQLPGFNRGVWKRLEELVRAIALREKEIYVVTGAMFPSADEVKYLPSGRVTIPKAFYKVIFDLTPPRKMIGFIVPHRSSNQPLQVFAVSVDEVEKQTGLDFFSKLPDDQEAQLEAMISIKLWLCFPHGAVNK